MQPSHEFTYLLFFHPPSHNDDSERKEHEGTQLTKGGGLQSFFFPKEFFGKLITEQFSGPSIQILPYF